MSQELPSNASVAAGLRRDPSPVGLAFTQPPETGLQVSVVFC